MCKETHPRSGLTLRSTIIRMEGVSSPNPEKEATIEAASWWLQTLERKITRLKEENLNLKKTQEELVKDKIVKGLREGVSEVFNPCNKGEVE